MMSSPVEARLVLTPAMVRQLRPALVADLQSLGRELLQQIPDAPFVLVHGKLDAAYVDRFNSRQALLGVIGWPGQALPEREFPITGDANCALAVVLLANQAIGQG